MATNPPTNLPTPTLNELKKYGPPSKEALISAFKKAVETNNSRFLQDLNLPQNNAERVRLRGLIEKDPVLINALDRAQQQFPTLRKKSLILSQKPQIPPIYKAKEAISNPFSGPAEPITNPEQAKQLQIKLNSLSQTYYDFYAKNSGGYIGVETASKSTASQGAQMAQQQLVNWLIQAKADFSPYLRGMSREMIISALGPIGRAWEFLESTPYKLNPKHIHPLLNPDLIHHSISALNQKAFKVIQLPFKTCYGILSNLGLPGLKILDAPSIFFNPITQKMENRNSSSIIVSSFHNFYTSSQKLADKLDKWSGRPTSSMLEHPFQHHFVEKLEAGIHEHKKALKNGKNDEIKTALNNLNELIDSFAGIKKVQYEKGNSVKNRAELKKDLANFSRGLTRKFSTTLAKNLRRVDRDIFSYFGSILGGIIWQGTLGLAANALIYVSSRLLRVIPGFNTARAYITNFIYNNPAMTSTRIFGSNIKNLTRGAISLNAFSSGYLGFQLGRSLFPNIPIVGAVSGGITYGLGTFYQTGLFNITKGIPLTDSSTGTVITMPGVGPMPEQLQAFFQQTSGSQPVYRRLFGFGPKTQLVYSPIEKLKIKTNLRFFDKGILRNVFGFSETGKGWLSPITKFSAWLWKNPYFRLPFQGLTLRNLLLNFLPPEILSIKFLNIPIGSIVNSLPLIDYAWQVKSVFFSDVAKLFSSSKFGDWVGKKIYSPIQKRLLFAMYDPHLPTPSGATGWLRNTNIFNKFYPKSFLTQARPWLKVLRNTLNPGFFLGFTFLPYFFTINPFLAFSMPLVLSGLWTGASYLITKNILNISKRLTAIGRINFWGYAGTAIGALTQSWGFSQFGINPQIWTAAWTIGLPTIAYIAPKALTWLAKFLLGRGITFLSTALINLSAGITGLTVAIQTALGGLAILIPFLTTLGVVITSGFILYTVLAAFYVPFLNSTILNSNSFNLDSSTPQTVSINETVNICSSFSIVENPLLLQDYWFDFTARFNTHVWQLPSTLNYLPGEYSVKRLLPSSWHPTDRPQPPAGWQDQIDQAKFSTGTFDLQTPQTNDQFSINLLQPPSLSNTVSFFRDVNFNLGAFGLDRADQTHIRGKKLSELQNEFPSIAAAITPYLAYLKNIETQTTKEYYLEELQAQITLNDFYISQAEKLKNQLHTQLNYFSLPGYNSASNDLTSLLNQAANPQPPQNIAGKVNDFNEKLTNCGTDTQCIEHFKKIINIFEAWPVIFNELETIFAPYITLALEAESQNFAQPNYSLLSNQIQTDIDKLEESIAQLKTTNTNLQKDYDTVNPLQPYNKDFSSLSDIEIQNLLSQFDELNTEFYYLPKNTAYQICIQAVFSPDLTIYDLTDPLSLAQAYQDAAVQIEIAKGSYSNQIDRGEVSSTIIFTPPTP